MPLGEFPQKATVQLPAELVQTPLWRARQFPLQEDSSEVAPTKVHPSGFAYLLSWLLGWKVWLNSSITKQWDGNVLERLHKKRNNYPVNPQELACQERILGIGFSEYVVNSSGSSRLKKKEFIDVEPFPWKMGFNVLVKISESLDNIRIPELPSKMAEAWKGVKDSGNDLLKAEAEAPTWRQCSAKNVCRLNGPPVPQRKSRDRKAEGHMSSASEVGFEKQKYIYIY